MHRYLLAILGVLLAIAANAFEFNNIVTLGDSLQDDGTDGKQRSPVAAEQLGLRLGIPVTQLAVGGSTSSSLIESGQHTQAAEQFGEGDLAILWIGGNDVLDAGTSIALGNYMFLDTLEENTATILDTLTEAGMDVVVFNLPNMGRVPGVIEQVPDTTNFTEISQQWRDRLNTLAETRPVTVVDMYTAFELFNESPELFTVDGEQPDLGPGFAPVEECPLCIWYDEIHPSSLGQGFIANSLFLALNARFDPAYSQPIMPMSQTELASLASVETYVNAAGLWYDPAFDGEGYNLLDTPVGNVVYYYGYDSAGERLWLVSDVVPERLALGQPLVLPLLVAEEKGDFGTPLPPEQLVPWGEVTITLDDCNNGTFELNGNDGFKTHTVQKLIGIEGNDCSVP